MLQLLGAKIDDTSTALHFFSVPSSTDATALSLAFFGKGTGPILLDGVQCNGTEDRLVDCVHDSGTSDCLHTEDASVHCQTTHEYNPPFILKYKDRFIMHK